ncbi:unnamed protein product, partial [Ectocarpus fasciculatus]
DTSTASPADAGANGRGRDRYESIDGETLLGKLLDEDAPSAAFEDDHQKLLHKLMRVRDDEYSPLSSPSSSSSTECLECPVLRESLAERSAEVENAREQQVAAQNELEASEHRVHVMAADIASLQRKLAEHADVIRQGRALADKVVAAPDVGTPQVQAAQNFKELSDKVTNGRGDSRGKKRSPKGQAAAARGRRLGRGG